jgi:SAM-dependent methyltransferase
VKDYFRLPGGDDISETVLVNGEVLRTYKSAELFDEAVTVLHTVQAVPELSDLIVPTKIQINSDDRLTLQHATLSFNLPEHWTLHQYLDVIKSHHSLLQNLKKNQLALKDHLSENFVMDHGRPVFVDFGSIVKENSRKKISWINEGRGRRSVEEYLISDMMFPFMLLPLFVGLINSENEMRQILKYEYCNSGFGKPSWKRINFKSLFFTFKPRISLRVFAFILSVNFYRSETQVLVKAIKLFELLIDGSRRSSNYLDYYKSKDEQFDFDEPKHWNSKQISVGDVLSKENPAVVLDLGCNTGWFSVLAAKNNCRVKSVDIDPVIVDQLYLQAKRQRLDIDVSVLDFHSIAFFKQIRISDNDFSENNPRRLPPASYDSDLVLALGLIHHLVLGLGYSPNSVMQLLASLTRKTLVLEFISLDDEKIRLEENFFPALNDTKSNYSRENIIESGLTYFSKVESFPSNPDSREILVFSKS